MVKKSAVLNYLNIMEMKNEEINRSDVVVFFQKAVVDFLFLMQFPILNWEKGKV